MTTTLNINLSFMNDAVADLDDNIRMQQQKSNVGEINFNVEAGNADVGILSRKSSGQFDDNNNVRQILVNSLKVQFGVNDVLALPDSVKNALKIGSWRDDFKFDAEGNVTSGRPLTARRIKAVINAVKSELDVNKGIDNAWHIVDSQAKAEKKQPKRDVFEYFVEQVKTIPSEKLDAFEDGVDEDVFFAFAKSLHSFEKTLYKNMPERVISAVDGGDGEIWREIITEIVVGRMPPESRCNLLKYVNSDNCINYMRDNYAHIDDDLSDDEVVELNSRISYMAMLRLSVCNFFSITAKDI